MEPRDALVIPGNSLTLNCSTQLSDDIVIEWYHDEDFVDTDFSPYYNMLPTGALEILPSIPDDLLPGEYYCTILNRELGLIESRKARVTLASKYGWWPYISHG